MAGAMPSARVEWVEGGHLINPAHPAVLRFVDDVLGVSGPSRENLGDRRLRALDRAAGALPGVWPAGALDKLRDERR
jgi:hypothetical protein